MKYNLSLKEIIIRWGILIAFGPLVAVFSLLFLLPVVLYLFLTALLGSDPIKYFVFTKKLIELPEFHVSGKNKELA